MDRSTHEHWERLAALHGTGEDRYYRLDDLVAGGSLMGDAETAALGRATAGAGLAGRDVMHLQCHIGCDTITMARAGARVTGVDFSATALARLRELATRCGVSVSTLEADAAALPHDVDSSFDLVYATVGVLCWIDDLDAWMSGVARALRPTGTLVLVEMHPILQMIDTIEPLDFDFPYQFDGPHQFSGVGSYANRDADVTWTTTVFAHGLAEVITAATGAGLVMTFIEEHLSMSFNPVDMSQPLEPDGRFRLRLGRSPTPSGRLPEPLPVLYTLIATKPHA